jgi:FixJ family two-component response regulator
LLKSLGYAAAYFASAEEYLASPLRRDTTCLILDVHMPGTSGLQLQARLVAEADRTPIIFVSGAADEGTKKSVLQAGARGFLSKPLDQATLMRLLGDSATNIE